MNNTRHQQHHPKIESISQIKSLDYLIQNYPDQNLIPQFQKLKKEYPYYRAVRGEGNCFYRAIAFLYLREADLERFSNVFKHVQNNCINIPVDFQSESLYFKLQQLYQNYLRPLSLVPSVERQTRLQKLFEDFIFDTLMVIYLRSLNYRYIKGNQGRFMEYISDKHRIQKIRQFGQQSEGIEYAGMSQALGITIGISIVQQSVMKWQYYNKTKYNKVYDLFFRPGHFDIFYHSSSDYTKQAKFNKNYIYDSPQQRIPNQKVKFVIQPDQYRSYQNEISRTQKPRNEYPIVSHKTKPLFLDSQNPNEMKQSQRKGNIFQLTTAKLGRNQTSQFNSKQKQEYFQVKQVGTPSSKLAQSNSYQKKQPTIADYTAWKNQKTVEGDSFRYYKQVLSLSAFFLLFVYLSIKF